MRPAAIPRYPRRARRPRCPPRSVRAESPACAGRPPKTPRTHPSTPDTASSLLGATACRAPAGTSPAVRRCRCRQVSASVRRCRTSSRVLLLLEVSGFARTHVLRQLVVKVDGAALAVRVGLRARKARRLHALLNRGHIREVLRQDGPPVGIADRGVCPLRLRLFAFRIQ